MATTSTQNTTPPTAPATGRTGDDGRARPAIRTWRPPFPDIAGYRIGVPEPNAVPWPQFELPDDVTVHAVAIGTTDRVLGSLVVVDDLDLGEHVDTETEADGHVDEEPGDPGAVGSAVTMVPSSSGRSKRVSPASWATTITTVSAAVATSPNSAQPAQSMSAVGAERAGARLVRSARRRHAEPSDVSSPGSTSVSDLCHTGESPAVSTLKP